MTRHLKTCDVPGPNPSGRHSCHLFVDARYDKTYWMHLAVPVEGPLSEFTGIRDKKVRKRT